MRPTLVFSTLLAVAGLCATASADTVTLITGRTLEGTVLQETKDNVIVQLRYSVTTHARRSSPAGVRFRVLTQDHLG